MHRLRLSRWMAICSVCVVTTACRADLVDPSDLVVRFLAIVTEIERGTIGETSRMSFQIQERELGIDTTILVSPGDTIAVEVGLGYYLVEASEPPLNCVLRGSNRRYAAIDEETGTAIVRYEVRCKPPITVYTETLGSQLDESLVYRVWSEDQVVGVGTMGSNDSTILSNLEPGEYDISLHHVAENCLVVNPGGVRLPVAMRRGGGAEVRFDVRCSDQDSRPRFLDVRTSYHDSVSAVYFEAFDPNADISSYFWDITDCRGNSVLEAGGREMDYLRWDRTAQQNTITVISAFEVGIPDEAMRGRCVSLRLEDLFFNSSERRQIPITAQPGNAPVATMFNARLAGSRGLEVQLEAEDADGDFVGTFAALRLRDGTLGVQDGDWDIGIYNTVGYLGTDLPFLQFRAVQRIKPLDVIGSIVYLIDRAGHFTRLEDRDTFR